MSTSRKVIKILCILTILEGICVAISAILYATGVVKLDESGMAYLAAHTNGNTAYLTFTLLFVAIFEIVEGFLGVKGANVPSKMFPFLTCTTAAIAYYCTEFLHTLIEGTPGFGMIANLIVCVVVWYFAYKTWEESKA